MTDEAAYDLELYKSLRHEAAAYIEKIPAIWLQKFLFAGAVVAFIVAKPLGVAAVASRSQDFVIAGFICVPVLALLLDIKIFEYSLHARAISRFIETQFGSLPRVAAWESALWGGGTGSDVTNLARYRSAATVVVTLMSTAVLIVLSGMIVGSLQGRMVATSLIAFAIAAIYVAAGIWSSIVIWPRLMARARANEEN